MQESLPLDGVLLALLTQPRMKKMTATVPVTVSLLWKSTFSLMKEGGFLLVTQRKLILILIRTNLVPKPLELKQRMIKDADILLLQLFIERPAFLSVYYQAAD